MVYKSFRLRLVLRIALIAATSAALAWSLLIQHWIITSVILSLVLALQIIDLFWFTDKMNRELARFISAIKYRDLSQTFTGAVPGRSLHELHDAFNLIIEEYRKLGHEREEHHQYMQTVVEHVSLGLLAFDRNGEIQLMNRAAKELLNIPYVKNIRGLEKISNELAEALQKLQPGKRELVKVLAGNELLELSIHAAGFKLGEKEIRLVSLQNIRSELSEKELDAWQKLIRVLTHEIMNSVTPVTSLTSSAIALIEKNGEPRSSIDAETITDVHNALVTVEKRSKGLLNFVDVYRNLTRIPKPDIREVNTGELISNVHRLMKQELANRKIDFTFTVSDQGVKLFADEPLIEQVLINLLLNAMDAAEGKEHGAISINAFAENGRSLIQVKDNGNGMDEETIANIFVPFYTTKAKGSGIGLSLSQQIMRLHQGSITVQSVLGKGSTFTLKF
jgi:two-component system nitrogen regulation sensor histidine kinase NtrY